MTKNKPSLRFGLNPVAIFGLVLITVAAGSAAAQSFASGNTITVKAAEDTFVSDVARDTDHSNLPYLRTDANPIRQSYLKFHVPADSRTIQKAVFRIHSVTASSSGFKLFRLPSAWTDRVVRYNNRPALGNFIATSKKFTAGSWIQVDATAYVSNAGTYGFGIVSVDSAGDVYDSSKTANTPQLVITYAAASLPAPSPSVTVGLVPSSSPAPTQTPSTLVTPSPTAKLVPSGAGSLSLLAALPSVPAGTTFTVQVRENSGTTPINAVQANLAYDAGKLQYVSSASATGSFPLSAATTLGTGTLQLSRAIPGGSGAVTGDKSVATVMFKVLSLTGTTRIDFGPGSTLISTSGNILKITTGAVITAGTPDAQAPTAPSTFTASASAAPSVLLAWSTATDNVGVAKYIITRGTLVIASVTGSTLRYSDTTVLPGTTYIYRVSAIDATGSQSLPSTSATVSTPQPTVLDSLAPSAPSGLTVVAALPTQANLRWVAAIDNVGVAGYRVYQDTILVASLPASITSYGNGQILAGSKHSYTVSAVDAAGNESRRATPVSITTHQMVPVGASLYLSPAAKTVSAGTSITFQVRMNSGTNIISAVQADLSFDSAKLQYINSANTGAAFPLEAVTTPGPGSIQLTRSVPGGSLPVSGDQLVTTVSFRALVATGTTSITFGTGSLIATSTADNILSATVPATITIGVGALGPIPLAFPRNLVIGTIRPNLVLKF